MNSSFEKKSKKNKKGRKGKGSDWVNTTPLTRLRPASVVRRLSYVSTASISASTGLLINPASVRSTANEWGSISAIYTQYRVLAIRVRTMVNATSVIGQTSVGSPAYVMYGTDRSGSIAATASPNSIWALDQPFVHALPTLDSVLPSYEARAIDLEDQNYVAVGSNQTSFGILLVIVTSNSVAFNYWNFVDALVEFKGAA